MLHFLEIESDLCFVPVFDVVVVLTACSVIDHCIEDENCTRAV
jgi:hypothetical protein